MWVKNCAGRKKKETYKRILDPSYDTDFTGTIHESLEVLECIDDHYEELKYISDLRKKAEGPIMFINCIDVDVICAVRRSR